MTTTLALDKKVPALPVQDVLAVEQRMGRVTRRGLWVLGIWGALFAGWATLAPISGGVVASGLVKVEANRRTVTHRDGGTVAQVLVREGQLVQKGDVLVELADVRVEASVDMLRAQLAADRLRLSRLEAESRRSTVWAPPEALLAEFRDVKSLPDQAAKERAAFEARQRNLLAQLDGEARQAEDTRTEIAVRLRERDNATKALGLMKEELALNQRLEQEQFINRTRVMSLQRAVSEYESRQLSNEAELAQARQRLGALDSRMRSLRDTLAQSASEEQREVGARASDTEQRLRASADDQLRQKVLAPESGRLVHLRVNTVGSALGPREPVVDIVPSGAPLLVEARLPLDAGAAVRPGTPAEIRLLTAHSRYETLLPAEVVQVSADALQDSAGGQPYLSAQLQIPASALKDGATAPRPGMAAEVYIRLQERTPVGFLLEPITGYFHRAFREH
jgi:HlyD family type I secretion membrane fusion protein